MSDDESPKTKRPKIDYNSPDKLPTDYDPWPDSWANFGMSVADMRRQKEYNENLEILSGYRAADGSSFDAGIGEIKADIKRRVEEYYTQFGAPTRGPTPDITPEIEEWLIFHREHENTGIADLIFELRSKFGVRATGPTVYKHLKKFGCR